MKEIWKDILGYEGLYQVSNLGNVKSLPKLCGHRPTKERLVTQCEQKKYKRVTLCKNNVLKKVSVHRLVANAFIPNPENKPCVNHKDENPSNNNVENLEWVTCKENTNYGTCIKRFVENMTKTHQDRFGQKVLCVEEGIIFPSLRQAGRWCNGNWSSISACAKGKMKKHKGYSWVIIGKPKSRIGYKEKTA